MWCCTLAVLLSVPGQTEKTAEEWMKQLEEKLSKAETVSVTAKMKTSINLNGKTDKQPIRKTDKQPNGSGLLSLDYKKGNKVKLTSKEAGENKPEFAFVSNGSAMKSLCDKVELHWTPDQLSEVLMYSLKYPGFYGFILAAECPKNAQHGRIKLFRVSDLRLNKKETAGEHDAQQISYRLTFNPDLELFDDAPPHEIPAFSVELWLDLKTGLPIKRTITCELSAETMTITEAYTKFLIDTKIDDKLFEIPK